MITRSQKVSTKSTQNTKNHHFNPNSSAQIKQCSVILDDIMKNKQAISKNPVNADNKITPCRVILDDILKPNTSHTSKIDLGDGKASKIFKCKSKLCKLKEFVPRDKAFSTCTKRIYNCIIPSGTCYLNCHSTNVVYLLTCSTCGLQYVGETVQPLSSRFSGHRTGIKSPNKYGTCKILTAHFNSGVCKGSNFEVQILEKIEGSGRTERNAMDVKVSSHRKQREDFWIKTIRTAYPYGLNDRLSNDYMKDQNNDRIGSKFYPLKRVFSRVGRGINRKGKNLVEPDSFLQQLNSYLHNNIREALNYVRLSLITMRKSHLKQVRDKINDFLADQPLDFPYVQWYSVALDIIDCRTYTTPTVKPKRMPLSNTLHVTFSSKNIEMINLPSILHDKEVIRSVPSFAKTFTPPTVVFSLNPPIRSKIFNFNKFVTTLDVEAFLQDESILPCNCSDSPYKDKHHGHIISGDLRLVTNNKLRKLFTKGPKYREKKFVDWEKIEVGLLDSVKKCAKVWCEKNKQDEIILKEWVLTVSNKINKKISFLKTSRDLEPIREILKNPECINSLNKLHYDFVVVPIDKASGNIGFVCKMFYAEVLVKELGLRNSSPCATYEKTDIPLNDIVEQDCDFLAKNFKLFVPPESKKLPHIYWLPKLHKNPIKFRFIIAAPDCSIKLLAKSLNKIFKLFINRLKNIIINHFSIHMSKLFG